MKNRYRLVYVITFDGDSPIKEECRFAIIEAYDVAGAYEKATEMIKKLAEAQSVMAVEVISLKNMTTRRIVYEKD